MAEKKVVVYFRGEKFDVSSVPEWQDFELLMKNKIPNLPDKFRICKRYEVVGITESASATKLKQTPRSGEEVLVIDSAEVRGFKPSLSPDLLAAAPYVYSITKAHVREEGLYFDTGKPNEVLQALADSGYYVPLELKLSLEQKYGDLQNARILSKSTLTPLLNVGGRLVWTDVLGPDYVQYMKDALNLYERLLPVYQADRNEAHYRRDLYDKLFDLARLHKRAGISGNQKFVLNESASESLRTSVSRQKFINGLKPDIADGWFLKFSRTNAGWELLGPNEERIKLRKMKQIGDSGDDRFMGMDLFVELKKQEHDADKYKVCLEAIGSLLCFQSQFDALEEDASHMPIVFCGTCSKLDIRFYAIERPDDEDKKRLGKPPSQSKQLQGDVTDRVDSPDEIKFVIRDLFATTVADLDSFFRFAMFLWRLKWFRHAQYNEIVPKLRKANVRPPLQLVKPFEMAPNPQGHQGPNNTNQPVAPAPSGSPRPTNRGNPRNENSRKVKDLFTSLRFSPHKYLVKNIYYEVCQGQVDGVDAFLKANKGPSDLANEISIYEYLQEKGFSNIPKVLGSYICENFSVLVVEKAKGKHVTRMETKDQVLMYSYKLLKVLDKLHKLNVAHGDLRPPNILYEGDNDDSQDLSNMTLIDFGFSHVFDATHSRAVTRGYSIGYSSPEVVSDAGLELKDDVFSAGIIIGEMICDYDVRTANADAELTNKIAHGDIPYGNKKLGALVLQMIAPRAERPAISQILEHEVFKQLSDTPATSDEEMKIC